MSEWHDDLTAEQRETVERAAKAAATNPPRVGFAADWDSLGKYGQAAACSDILAALRASGHHDFPPVKVPSRGETVAAESICRHRNELWFGRPGMGKTVHLILQLPTDETRHWDALLDGARELFAQHIDAERASARREAFEQAARVADRGLLSLTASTIRALAAIGGGK